MPLPIAHLLLHSPAASYAARAAGSSLLAGALARDLWRRIPEWIRQDIGFQDLLCSNDTSFDDEDANGGGNDEMASLMAVIQKLQALVTIGYDKLGSTHKRQRRRRKVERLLSSKNNNGSPKSNNSINEDSTTISTLEFHLALLAYVQLCNQIKERYPEWRDEMYDRYLADDQAKTIGYSESNLLDELSFISSRDDCSLDTAGTTAEAAAQSVTKEQIEEMIQLLDFSIMAYETNEELLKSQLHENGGYHLLIHRTTSSVVNDAKECNAVVEDKTMDKQQQQQQNSRRKPPGRVGYYVAMSPSENKLLIGIKGTSTLEDLLTDCCGRAVRCDLENNPHLREIDALNNNCSFGDEESDNKSDNHLQLNSNDDDNEEHSAAEKIIEEDNSSYDEIIDSNSHDLSEATDRGETSLSASEGYDDSNVDLIESDAFPDNLLLSPTLSSYEYFEIETIDDGHETVEVELIIGNNPKEAGGQQHEHSTKRDSHLLENILLLPSRQETKESPKLQRLLQELPTVATSSTIEDNGVEMQLFRSTKLRGAHEGILHSAQQLLQEVSPLIEEYALSKGFDVVCCGHSLGAGAAALLAILIRGKYASLVTPLVSEEKDNTDDDIGGESQRVRAYAFAPPPLLDRLSSLACRHYVTSVVNNSDIIPRSSLTNLDVLMTVLEAVICVLTEENMNPGGSNNQMLSSLALFRKLSEGTGGKLVIEPTELKRIQKEAIYEATLGDGGLDACYWNEDGDHHLLVPGKVMLLYQKWGENENKKLTMPPSDGSITTEMNAYNAVWTNGTVKMLKGFELAGGSQAVTDHLTASYFNALKCCLKES